MQVDFTAALSSPLEVSACIELSVRVYNPAGLYTNSSTEVTGCSPDDVQPLVVLDAVGEWEDGMVLPIHLETNNYWPDPDREVTGASHQLAAVWPALRHGQYNWKVKITPSPFSSLFFRNHLPYFTSFGEQDQNLY